MFFGLVQKDVASYSILYIETFWSFDKLTRIRADILHECGHSIKVYVMGDSTRYWLKRGTSCGY